MLERRIRIVELAPHHLADIHDRDVRAAAVLQELGVHDAAVVVHDEGGLSVLAEDDVRRVPEQLPVETPGIDPGPADDRIRRVVVLRPEGLIQIDCIDPGVPAARGQHEPLLRLGEVGNDEDSSEHREPQPSRLAHEILSFLERNRDPRQDRLDSDRDHCRRLRRGKNVSRVTFLEAQTPYGAGLRTLPRRAAPIPAEAESQMV